MRQIGHCFVPRVKLRQMETRGALQVDSDAFEISETLGFVLENPLTDLPRYYRVWMELATNLTHLIESRTLRVLVQKMPELSLHHLNSPLELRLAHLALGVITMGYVWQEGQHKPAQVLPKALAVPYWSVSQRLGLPPILTYADMILANWKLKDLNGDMEIGNIELIFSFPGGESCRGFFIVSLLVEMTASPGITGALEVTRALKTSDLPAIKKGLIKVKQALTKMRETFELMHTHVDPTAFYGTLRIFVSGWKDNPMLPNGLLYEDVSDEPFLLSGGSAAQSSAIHCFDSLLCIRHYDETGAFLARMKDYMPPAHRRLIAALSGTPSLRDFIMSRSSPDLCHCYNSCITALVDLRNYHINTVAKYVLVPANRAKTSGCPLGGVCTALDSTGTGGTNIMGFLKSVRNDTVKTLIPEQLCVSPEMEK